MRKDPKAMQAVRDEAAALIKEGTRLENTVCEKDDLIAWAKKMNKKIHLGELLTICSIKFSERSAEFWKLRAGFVSGATS